MIYRIISMILFIVFGISSMFGGNRQIIRLENGMSCIVDDNGAQIPNTTFHYIWPNRNANMPLKTMRVKSIGGNIIPVFGYITSDGNIIGESEYDYATNFNEYGFAAVGEIVYDPSIPSAQRIKYFIIDSNGNKLNYAFDYISETFENKMIVGFLRKFRSPFDSHYIYAMDYSYLNANIRESDPSKITSLFSSATSFENGVAAVSNDIFGKRKFLIDENLDSIAPYDDRQFSLCKRDGDLPFGWSSIWPFKVEEHDGIQHVTDTVHGQYIQPDVVIFRSPSKKIIPEAMEFVYKHGLIGSIDTYGTIISPMYKNLKLVADSLFTYKNDKLWGFVGLDGRIICQPAYDCVYDGFYKECIVKDSLWNESVANHKGRLLYPLRKGSIRDITPKQWRYSVKRGIYTLSNYNKNDRYCNILGVNLLSDTLQFSKVDYNPQLDVINAITFAGDTILIGNTGTILRQSPHNYSFSSYVHLYDWLQNENNEKYEYYALQNHEGSYAILKVDLEDRTHTLITDFEYTVAPGRPYAGYNRILVMKNGLFGFLDTEGQEVISFKYEDASEFSSTNLARVKLDGKYGFIDLSGKERIKCIYEHCDNYFIDNLCRVCSNGKKGIINIKGKEVLPCIYDDIGFPRKFGKSKYLIAQKGDQYFIYNSKGRLLLGYPLEKVAGQWPDRVIGCKDGLWGFIIPNRKPIFCYSEVGTHWENLLAVKHNSKWGFVDIEGNLAIPCIYDAVDHAFWNGIAIVRKDSERIVIDEYGAIITDKSRIAPILARQNSIENGLLWVW